MEIRHHRAEHFLVAGQGCGAHGCHRHTMVAVAAGQDFHLFRLAHALPVVAGEFEGGFVRFRAARGEIGRRHVAIGQTDDTLGEADCRLVREPGIGRRVGQLFHLRRRSIGQFLAAMPDIDVPQARQTVDIFFAVVGPQHRALATDEDFRRRMVLGMMQRVDQMPLVRFEQRTDVVHGVLRLGFRGRRVACWQRYGKTIARRRGDR